MSYVENNLILGEQVIYNAKVHWFIFVPSVVCFVTGIFLFNIRTQEIIWSLLVGMLLIIIAIISLISAFITRFSTELVVTSKRVIAKVGFIRRNTIELNNIAFLYRLWNIQVPMGFLKIKNSFIEEIEKTAFNLHKCFIFKKMPTQEVFSL